MTDSGAPQDSGIPQEISVHNQQALEELAWAIEMAQGSFTLILARCSYVSLRDRMVEQLRQVCPVTFQVMVLQPSVTALYAAIRDHIGETQPNALMVFGLETVSDLEQLLTLTNQVREEFRKNLPFPLVLWVTDDVHSRLVRSAPDFESWATTTEFAIAPSHLLSALHQAANQLFTALLVPDSPLSFRKLLTRLAVPLLRRQELEAALRDLQTWGQPLDADLQASLCFFRGVNAGVSHEAVAHLQSSLVLWQQVAADATESESELVSLTVLKLGLSHFFLGQCQFYLDSQNNQRSPNVADTNDLSDAKRQLQQAVATFEQAHRLDLVAKCVGQLKRTLERLADWDELTAVAQQSVMLHQTYGDSSRLAQDYRYLAEAALRSQQGIEAKQLAQQALDQLATNPEDQRWQGLYLLTLAKAERRLGNETEAIAQLQTAYDLGDQGVPRLFVQVLEELRDIYLTQKQYLAAFQLKLTRLSVEQQYGIRAFVGAGRLRPKREDAEKLIEPRHPANVADEVAPEIRSSGRQQDLDQLLQRLGDTEHRLIVVCGYSGVGKSSLVVAGLVPALKQRAIGFRVNRVVLVRAYGNWVEDMERQLEISPTPDPSTPDPSTPDPSTQAILEQLRYNEQHNRRTILIFDQFEEFFFVYPDLLQRRRFFEFLGQCLQVLSVKVILSLREDYLHYLLEGSRIASIRSTGIDILSQNVLYSLGNFSPANATAIIHDLTERAQFYLEADLIEALVQDLAGELQEVRPIELQVVGAQLQDDGITSLAQYRACGESPKAELVKRYLAQSVADCGSENQQIAELVLYLLTDEKGTRPLKTRPELERDLQAIAPDPMQLTDTLDLVLHVLVGSGLVVLLPEIPTDRYQLVHDYIAAFIRQQQGSQLDRLIAELEAERQQRRLNEAELAKEKEAKQILEAANQEAQQTNLKANQRLRLASGFLLFAVIAGVTATAVALWTRRNLDEAQEVIRLERAGVQAQQQFEFDQLASLVSAVQAGEDLKTLMHNRDTEIYPAAGPVLALQTISDKIQEQSRLRRQQGSVRSVVFSPDGTKVVTAGEDGTARLWSLDGKELQQFKGHQGIVWSVTFSPDSTKVVTAGEDGTARLWSLDGKQLQQFKGHQGRSNSVAFSPDGTKVVTAGKDGTVRLWSLDGKELQQFKGHQDGVRSVAFSPDGTKVVTAGEDGTARLWSLNSKELQQFKGHQGGINSVAFSPDGTKVVTAGVDGTARLWLLDGKELQQFKGHQGIVRSVAFSPDGTKVVTAGVDGTARLWSLDGKELQQFKGQQGIVLSVAFSPDGTKVLTAGVDGTARLWSLDGKELQQFKGHQGIVLSVTFSPDGTKVVTAGEDGTARLWSLDGKQLQQFKGHQGIVWSVAFSPDSTKVVTAGEDGTARLWSLDGKQLQQFKGHQGRVKSVTFSPDGTKVVTAGEDGTARLWSLDGKQLQQFKGHQGIVWSVAFSPDSTKVVTAGEDGTVKVSPVYTLTQLLERGCTQLNNFLIAYPKQLQTLTTCQNDPKTLAAAAPNLVKDAEYEARTGSVDVASNDFRTALTWNPSLTIDIEARLKQLAIEGKAQRFVTEGESLARTGEIQKAITAYNQAAQLNPAIDISADSWNTLCWNASLHKQAKAVIFACEKAVVLAPQDGGIRDSRGLARALTGNRQGAIADFQFYVDWTTNKERKTQRQKWIRSLKAGQNPFTAEELQKLLNP